MPPRLIQRHDQFFKRLLDKPGAAGALLRERLPPEIAARLADEVRYVLAEPNVVKAQILREVLAEIMPGQEERIMSIAAEEWKAEGMAAGLHRGQARTLLRQLERRFGPLPDAVRERLFAADTETLDQWADRVLDAPNLDAVFEDGRSH